MNALAVLTDARDLGVKVTVDGDKIILEGVGLTDELVAGFKANKSEILKLLTTVPVTAEPTATPEPEAADQDITPRRCDDCGRTSPVLLITTYGGAYCRACVTFQPKRVPAPRPPTDLEVEQAGKPLLGHAPEGLAIDLKLFGDGPKGGAV